MNFANVWVAPRRDFAVLVCVNQGGDTAFKASDAAASALIGYHSTMAKDRGDRKSTVAQPNAAADADKPRR